MIFFPTQIDEDNKVYGFWCERFINLVCFYHFWQISHGIGLNILAFIPTVILGIMGGLLGAVFTFLNLKVLHLKVLPINNYCVRFL